MKIALIGYGKMGKAIERIAEERGHVITQRFNSDLRFTEKNISTADVAIEFTRPELAVNHIKTALAMQLPIVVGTTAWGEKLAEISNEVTTQNGSLLYASNFSLGVNIFTLLVEQLATALSQFPEYNWSIEETHHLQKLDAPSGTAVTLAESIISRHAGLAEWQLNPSETNDSVLPILAHRLPDVPGTHVIKAASRIDTLTLSHEAHNRDGFALGAVMAAEFLIGKQGVFTMKDVLNLK